MTFSTRPQALGSHAARRWRYGDDFGTATTEEPPIPGDLWLITETDADFGETDRALVLVTKVIDDYALAVPVTPTDAPAHAPALRLDHNALDVPLIVWPHLETGLAFATLRRRVGVAMEAFALARLRAYGDGRTNAPLPVVEATYDETVHGEHTAHLIATMAWACEQNTGLLGGRTA